MTVMLNKKNMNIFYDLDEDNLLLKSLVEEYWQNTSGKFTYRVQD